MQPETYNDEPFPAGAYGNVTNTFTFLLEFIKKQSWGENHGTS